MSGKEIDLGMPKIKASTETEWLAYHRAKSNRDHKEIMTLKSQVSALEAERDALRIECNDWARRANDLFNELSALRQRVEGSKKLTLWWVNDRNGKPVLKRATDDIGEWRGSTVSELDRFEEVYAVPVKEMK